MSERLRLSASIAVLIGGLAFSIWYGIEQLSWCHGVAAAASSVYVAAWMIFGCANIRDPVFALIGLAIGVFGATCLFITASATDATLISARFTVASRLAKTEIRCKGAMNPELLYYSEVGPMVCMSSHIDDQFSLLNDLAKSAHLGVTGSLIDSIIQATIDKDSDFCAEIFVRANAICPALFWKMPDAEIRALQSRGMLAQ